MRFVLFWNIVVFLNKRSFYCWKLCSFLSLWCLAEKWEMTDPTLKLPDHTQRKSLFAFSLWLTPALSSCHWCVMCLCFRWCVLTGDHDGPALLLTSDIRAPTDIRQSRGAPPHTRPGPPGRPWRPAPASPARWAPWSPESPSSASSAWNRNTISTGRKESGSHYREEVLPVAFSEDLGEYISCQKIYDHRGMFLICWCQPWARLVQRTRLCLHHYLCHNLVPVSPPAPDVSMLQAL